MVPNSWGFLTGAYQSTFRLLQAHQRFPAELQQGPQALIDVRVALQQFTEVTNLVQLLLVVIHAGLHQQAGDSVF
jgi:hypothetical protein